METDVKILVRARELACRNAWGDDLWSDTASPATTSPTTEPQRRTFTYLTNRLDDEVTSVIDASVRLTTKPTGDDIVTLTSVRPSDGLLPPGANDVNAAAVADQEERARVMARGSRDAILSARKRHVERRTQGSDPAAGDADASSTDATASDQVIATSGEVDTVAPAATATSQTSLPEPAITAEAVASDVGLPRLRSFLRGEDSPSGAVWPVTTSSSFDHVMRQAELIKERSAINRPEVLLETVIFEEAIPDSIPLAVEPPIVWDVDPAALDVAFGRARQAIETPLDLSRTSDQEDVLEIQAEPETTLDPIAEASPRLALYQQPQPIAMPAAPIDTLVEEGYDDDDFGVEHLEMEGGDEYVDDLPYEDVLVPDESPRSSLWRSFNQRLRQHFRFQAASSPHEEEYYEAAPFADDEELAFGAAVEPPALGFQSDDPDSWYTPLTDDPESIDESATWQADGLSDHIFVDEDEAIDPWKMTSEENWRLDELEFPEPQPVHWHDFRQELLASLPPVEALDDSVQLVAPTPQSTPAEPIRPRRPLPDPKDFFDISEPGGLAAFRAVLFGSQSRDTSFQQLEAAPATLSALASAARFAPRRQAPPRSYNDGFNDVYETGYADRTPVEELDLYADDPRAESSSSSEPSWAQESLPPRQARTRQVEVTAQSPTTERRTSRRQVSATPIPPTGSDKRCETCRSFQAAEDGGRGWCTNAWASTRNAMVNANELACRSSFGDWWIAADDAWSHQPEPDNDPDGPQSTPSRRRVRTRNIEE